MAYYDPTDEDPLNPSTPQQVQTGPESGVISGQGSTPTNVASSAPLSPDKPGNFVGIQQYLAQNKPQSAKLAENVGGYVSEQGDKAEGALSQGQSQYDQAVDQNTVKLDEGLFNQAKESPEEVANDQDKKAQFQKMRDAQYKGPTSLEESDYYQPINMAIQNALGTAQNTQSAEGRSQLLADMQREKGQKVSRGAANLDAALLSTSPDSRNILSQAKQSIDPLNDQLKAVSEAEAMKAKAAQDQTAKTQAAIQAAFAGPMGVQGQLESGLKAKSDAAIQKSGIDADAILNLLKNPPVGTRRGNFIIPPENKITDEQLKMLGLTRNQFQGLVNDQDYYKSRGQASPLSDLASFATKLSPQNQISPQTIASDSDYAKYQALNDLMGTSNGFLYDPSMAGKANSDAIDFKFDQAPSALSDRVNSISSTPLQPQTQNPVSFADMNKQFNLNGGSAKGLANSIASYPEYASYYGTILSNLQNGLDSINSAYNTNLQVPEDYLKNAEKSVRDEETRLIANPSLVTGGVKKKATDADISTAAQIMAYTTYLNDISKNPSLVRGSSAPTNPPGQFFL
jgi:hypothetical protein